MQASESQNRSTNGHPGFSVEDGAQSYTIPTQRLAPTQNVAEVCCNPPRMVDRTPNFE